MLVVLLVNCHVMWFRVKGSRFVAVAAKMIVAVATVGLAAAAATPATVTVTAPRV